MTRTYGKTYVHSIYIKKVYLAEAVLLFLYVFYVCIIFRNSQFILISSPALQVYEGLLIIMKEQIYRTGLLHFSIINLNF